MQHLLLASAVVLFAASLVACVPLDPEGCNFVLKADRGQVTSPNFPSPYSSSLNCTWLIQYLPGYTVYLAFAKFESEYGVDVLSIYDGPDQSWPLLRTHSGYGPEPEPVQSTSNSMFITFVTNGGQEMSGFDARYITLKQKPALAPELH